MADARLTARACVASASASTAGVAWHALCLPVPPIAPGTACAPMACSARATTGGLARRASSEPVPNLAAFTARAGTAPAAAPTAGAGLHAPLRSVRVTAISVACAYLTELVPAGQGTVGPTAPSGCARPDAQVVGCVSRMRYARAFTAALAPTARTARASRAAQAEACVSMAPAGAVPATWARGASGRRARARRAQASHARGMACATRPRVTATRGGVESTVRAQCAPVAAATVRVSMDGARARSADTVRAAS